MSVQTHDFASLKSADLVVDAVYRGGKSGNAGDDPLAQLLPVGVLTSRIKNSSTRRSAPNSSSASSGLASEWHLIAQHRCVAQA